MTTIDKIAEACSQEMRLKCFEGELHAMWKKLGKEFMRSPEELVIIIKKSTSLEPTPEQKPCESYQVQIYAPK